MKITIILLLLGITNAGCMADWADQPSTSTIGPIQSADAGDNAGPKSDTSQSDGDDVGPAVQQPDAQNTDAESVKPDGSNDSDVPKSDTISDSGSTDVLTGSDVDTKQPDAKQAADSESKDSLTVESADIQKPDTDSGAGIDSNDANQSDTQKDNGGSVDAYQADTTPASDVQSTPDVVLVPAVPCDAPASTRIEPSTIHPGSFHDKLLDIDCDWYPYNTGVYRCLPVSLIKLSVNDKQTLVTFDGNPAFPGSAFLGNVGYNIYTDEKCKKPLFVTNSMYDKNGVELPNPKFGIRCEYYNGGQICAKVEFFGLVAPPDSDVTEWWTSNSTSCKSTDPACVHDGKVKQVKTANSYIKDSNGFCIWYGGGNGVNFKNGAIMYSNGVATNPECPNEPPNSTIPGLTIFASKPK